MHRNTIKAMHLAQGGVSLEFVRVSLGHADIKTIEMYARANLEIKRAAIEKVSPAPAPDIPSRKENNRCCNGCNVYEGPVHEESKPCATAYEQDVM